VALVMGSAAMAILGTALGLYLLEIPANMLTLAGLGMGIGVLVQNGLVIVERLRGSPDTPAGRADVATRMMPGGGRGHPHHRGGALPVPLPAGECAGGVLPVRGGVRAGVGLLGGLGAGDGPRARQGARAQGDALAASCSARTAGS
jgi:hypothetical protein